MALSQEKLLEIQKKAEDVFQSSGGEVPTKLVSITKQLGYDLNEFVPDEKTSRISGALNQEKRTIYINNRESTQKKRFMLAHQIGHALLHGVTSFDYRDEDMGDGDEEREANFFARCLLTPGQEFARVWNECGGDADALALHFNIATPVVHGRARELGLE